jgi:hypothetical protein
MVQDHHRSMVEGEASEATIELVAIDDRAQLIGRHRLTSREETDVRRPTTSLGGLRVTGAHEEAVRPGIEACRVAKLRKVPPDAQQRLLRRILGQAEVAQDPVRRGKEPIRSSSGEGRECPLSPFCASFTRSVSMPLPSKASVQTNASDGMGPWIDANFNLRTDVKRRRVMPAGVLARAPVTLRPVPNGSHACRGRNVQAYGQVTSGFQSANIPARLWLQIQAWWM